MRVHVSSAPEDRLRRTTIEMKPEHPAKLLGLAAHRRAKGSRKLVSEALEAYLRAEVDREAQRKRAVLLKKAMPFQEAKSLRDAAEVLGTTVVTRFELLAGAKTVRQPKHVSELLAALPCLPLDEPAAAAAAEIRRTLERDGRQPHRRN